MSSYVPINPNVFTTALAAALASMAASGRNPTDSDQADYADYANAAGAFAEEFDTQWGVTVATMLDILVMNNEIAGAFAGRSLSDAVMSDYSELAAALIAIVLAARTFVAGQGISPPAWNNGGGGGGTGYLPADPPPDGTNNTLAVSLLGVTSWQPVGGYQITGFALSGAEVASTVEVGSSIAAINFAATYNFTPLAIAVNCTGKVTQTPAPTGETTSGSFTGPFTNAVNGAVITVSITATDPSGAPHTAVATITFAARVGWGSVSSPVAGQALYNTLTASNSQLTSSGNLTMGFTSGPGQQQTFYRLVSLGTPILKDSGGDVYPPVLVGTQTIVENGTSQAMNFWTVGAPGATFSWTMT